MNRNRRSTSTVKTPTTIQDLKIGDAVHTRSIRQGQQGIVIDKKNKTPTSRDTRKGE